MSDQLGTNTTQSNEQKSEKTEKLHTLTNLSPIEIVKAAAKILEAEAGVYLFEENAGMWCEDYFDEKWFIHRDQLWVYDESSKTSTAQMGHIEHIKRGPSLSGVLVEWPDVQTVTYLVTNQLEMSSEMGIASIKKVFSKKRKHDEENHVNVNHHNHDNHINNDTIPTTKPMS